MTEQEIRMEAVRLFIAILEKRPHVLQSDAGKTADEIIKGAEKLLAFINGPAGS